MLPKRSRLTKQTIEKYLLRARRVRTSRFILVYSSLPGNRPPQISVTVSKKIAPRAAARNRLRRRGYAALRPVQEKLAPGSIGLLSYAVPDEKTPIDDLGGEFASLFRQAGLYKK